MYACMHVLSELFSRAGYELDPKTNFMYIFMGNNKYSFKRRHDIQINGTQHNDIQHNNK
jgi:hypothetical protein